MGIVDDIFAQNASPTGAQPQQQPAPPPAMPQSYPDFYSRLISAANTGIDAQPQFGRGLLNLFTGNDRKAALARVAAGAPQLWEQFKQAQAQGQGGQLGAARDLAMTGALAGTTIDPNNIPASVPALTGAYSGAVNGTSATSPQSGGASVDPVQARRAALMRMAGIYQMAGNGAVATEYFKQANQGLPENTVLRPDGSVGDGVTGTPLNVDASTLAANRAGMVAAADTKPRVAGQLTVANNQAGLDRETNKERAEVGAQNTIETGIDTRTGLPTTATDYDIAHGNTPTFAKSNPFFDSQQAELKDLRTKSGNADQGLDLAQQISNAANGVFTGRGANALQNVRKLALSAGNLAGVPADKMISDQASQFEQLKFAGQQLVAVASHNLSPRVAMNIYNQISAVKPGDQTSVKGLRDIINNQIVPALQRDKAIFSGTSAYYQHNPLKNDAAAVVPGQNPLEKFGVRDLGKAQPGDFFIDPRDGRLRQRPVQ